MKTQLLIPTLLAVVILGICSCTTTCPGTATVPVLCVVQPQSSAVCEITLDGRLVGSCKVNPPSQQVVNFEAKRGEHTLGVTASGMVPYQKKIAVTGAGKNLQQFFVELKQKAE